ncbi:NADH dehydrogenase Fe-S protein subunit 6 ndufs6 [Balamuthia mandrillaris]
MLRRAASFSLVSVGGSARRHALPTARRCEAMLASNVVGGGRFRLYGTNTERNPNDAYHNLQEDRSGDLYQPTPAEDLISQVPPQFVDGPTAVCDGGGALGHPRIYINVEKPGVHACGYCGLRFTRAPGHH